jgi:hypothetical protein
MVFNTPGKHLAGPREHEKDALNSCSKPETMRFEYAQPVSIRAPLSIVLLCRTHSFPG